MPTSVRRRLYLPTYIEIKNNISTYSYSRLRDLGFACFLLDILPTVNQLIPFTNLVRTLSDRTATYSTFRFTRSLKVYRKSGRVRERRRVAGRAGHPAVTELTGAQQVAITVM